MREDFQDFITENFHPLLNKENHCGLLLYRDVKAFELRGALIMRCLPLTD